LIDDSVDHASAAGDDDEAGAGGDDDEESDDAKLSTYSLPFHSTALR
jgi:hypothetical protein